MNRNDCGADVRAILKRKVTDFVKNLLSMNVESHMEWNGTKGDLLELVGVAYIGGEIYSDDGSMMAFSDMVRRVFGVLHVGVLSNPYARLQRASMRKGVRAVSLMHRLEHVALRDGEEEIDGFLNALIVRDI